MGWATNHIEKLKAGKTVSFRKRRHTMTGIIEFGQLCTVAPIDDPATLAVGDIVLCVVAGSEYLHLVKAVNGARVQVGNNRAGVNEWIDVSSVFGRCVKVDTRNAI